MANDFSETEMLLHENVLEGFDKEATISNNVSKYSPDPTKMQRHGDTTWRPVPRIAETFDGLDLSAVTPSDLIDMQVPSKLSHLKSVYWALDSMENRDKSYVEQQGRAAAQALMAEVEVGMATNVAFTAGQVVKRGALQGYKDLAECESVLTEIGVARGQRKFCLNNRANNAIADNLSKSVANFGRSEPATSSSSIGRFANFDVMDTDLLPRLRDGSAATGATVNGADQMHVPAALSTAPTGEQGLVDNRYQLLTVDSTADMLAGDAFTIAGVNRVHLITKQDTATPFTNRVIEVVNGTTIKCLAMIDLKEIGQAEKSVYQNVTAAPANGAALTFLNTTAAQTNVFWHEESLELSRGRIAVDDMGSGGMGIMRGTTKNGVEIVMMKQSSIETTKTKYRFLIFFGTTNLNPLMNGVMLENQV